MGSVDGMMIRVAAALVVAAVLSPALPGAAAQQANLTCAASLIPCANYLNSTSPPETCCVPLRQAVKDQLPCLCAILNDPSLLQAFNINITEIDGVASGCGITDLNLCSAPAPSVSVPQHTPPPPPHQLQGSQKGAASSMSWIGMSGLSTSLILFWCFILVL